MTKFNSVEEFLNSISRGTFGVVIETMTEPKMNKRNNPYLGRVKKYCKLVNVALGYSYENVVNNRLNRECGENATTFESAKPTGKSWKLFPYLLCSDKDANKLYLRTTMRKNTKVEVTYYLDGEKATNEQINAFKEFFPAVKASAKQLASGLSEENEVIVRDYLLSNIVCLTQGEKVYEKDFTE